MSVSSKISLYQEVRATLRDSSFKPKRRLGQHFLIHQSVLDSIIKLLEILEEDEILEIGPGLGFLTRQLAESTRKVWAVEVDPFLVEWLRNRPWSSKASLDIIHADFLRLDLDTFCPSHQIKVVGNLPYNISTPVLLRLFEERRRFSSLVLMVQREVAERMAASPGGKSYGTLSVWCQAHGRILHRFSVSPEAFFPRPKVRSTVLKIELYPEPRIPRGDWAMFRALVRAAFGQRRKTLVNALRTFIDQQKTEIENLLRGQSIDPRRRGETLTLEEFARLARALKPMNKDQG